MAEEMWQKDSDSGGEEVASGSMGRLAIKKEAMLESLDRKKLFDTMEKGLCTMRAGFAKAKKALQYQDEFPEGSVMRLSLRELASTTMSVQSFMQAGEYAMTWNKWADDKPFDDSSLRAWCDQASMHTARMADLLKCIRSLQPKKVD
jgi:hypothetical protein